INVVTQPLALHLHVAMIFKTGFYTRHRAYLWVRAQPPFTQLLEQLTMTTGQLAAVAHPRAVKEDFQRARGADHWIQLPQAARRGITRIHERLLAACRRVAIHALETGVR